MSSGTLGTTTVSGNQNSNMTQSSSLPVAIKAALGLNQNRTRCPGIRTAWLWPFLLQSFKAALGTTTVSGNQNMTAT
jgi:hypothetical protein